MRKILKLITPENAELEFELAGLGSRFAALIIDYMIQGLMILLVLVGAMLGGISLNDTHGYDSVVIAAGIVIIFLIVFGYFIFFDMVMNGQSPGKKLFGLRVINENGKPLGFMDSFLRNILRFADFLPLVNFAGAFLIFLTPSNKRTGDYAAHTVVVKSGKNERTMNLSAFLQQTPENEPMKNIYPVNDLEYSVLREFLARKGKLGDRERIFLYHLNRYFTEKFNVRPVYSDPYAFLDQILKMNSGLWIKS